MVCLVATSLIVLLYATFVVVASASAVHSIFKGDLKDIKKKSKNFFSVQVVSPQRWSA